jgi:LuxR family transcriptional regulator, maltose regulon positive regulatory protein
LRQAEDVLAGYNPSPWAVARVEACRAWLWLAPTGGDLAAAARWTEQHASVLSPGAELPYLLEREHLALARVLVALGRTGAALALLERLRQAAAAGGRVGREIEVLAIEAAARQTQGERDLAMAALTRAMTLAEPEGYVSAFLDAGAPVAGLLSAVAAGRQDPRALYAQRLLSAWGISLGSQRASVTGSPSAPPAVVLPGEPIPWLEPLSERELEVLRLMDAGLTNGEIAERLVIAVSTVKRHINHIFAKLGASTRVQALVKARERRLL